jgi:hypothetical protein
MIMHQPHRRRGPWALAIVLALFTATAVLASDEGQAMADQVSQASYIDFMDNWLYTHAGDDRGYGPEHDLARDNIALLMESFGLTVTLEPFQYSGTTYYNVVGTKLGTTFPNQEIVLGAHYDSVNNPGADDDASGVALILEVARLVMQYDSDYTIRFIGFDREEQGLVGSAAYVQSHIFDDIVFMLEADMVAYDPGTNVALLYTRGDPMRASLAYSIDYYSGGLSWSDAGWTGASDHASFDSAGFEAALLIEGQVWSNPYYHTQDDNFDNPANLNFEYATRMTRTVAGWVTDVAGIDVPVDTISFDYPLGRPDFVDPSGGTTMRVDVTSVGGAAHQSGTGLLHVDDGSGWQSYPMEVVSADVYDAVFPAVTCETQLRYYVSVESTDGGLFLDPRYAPDQTYEAMAILGEIVDSSDDFDTDTGWTVSGDASTGQWERGTPVGGGDRGDPPTAFGGSGQCYLTGNTDGDSDIDGGTTILTSPALDVGGPDAYLEYALWYSNNTGSDPNDRPPDDERLVRAHRAHQRRRRAGRHRQGALRGIRPRRRLRRRSGHRRGSHPALRLRSAVRERHHGRRPRGRERPARPPGRVGPLPRLPRRHRRQRRGRRGRSARAPRRMGTLQLIG